MRVTIDLTGVRLKLERAAYHLDCLNKHIGPPNQLDLDLVAEHDPAEQAHRVIYIGHAPFPADLGVVFGDFIHNTRSALDLLVAAALRSNNKRVRRHHSYPFCLTRQFFEESILNRDPDTGPSRLDGLKPEHATIIGRHQPYVAGNTSQARRCPLNLLDRAWNVDKHRQVHIGTSHLAHAGTFTVKITPSPPFVIHHIHMKITPGATLESNMVIGYFRIRVPKGTDVSHLEPHMEIDVPAEVTFRSQGLKVRFGDLGKMLSEACDTARDFDPAFPDLVGV